MKRYHIHRDAEGQVRCRVVVKATLGATPQTYPLPHIPYHSDGFECGYGGSGPADLALSILADHFGEAIPLDHFRTLTARRTLIERSRCWKLHQPFKWHFIVPMDRVGGTISSAQIDAWLAREAPQRGEG
jgi:hypothetical protein